MPHKDPEEKKQYARKWRKKNREYLLQYNREWREKNRERYRKYHREWRKKNPEKVKAIMQRYGNAHRKKCNAYIRKWRRDNLEKARKITKRSNKKRRSTPKGVLNHRMEVSIREALKGKKKGRRWENLVGYTVKELKEHLEKQFEKWMTWDKFLNGEIVIDHIKPRSLFDFETAEDKEFKECWALSNLQPMEAIANIKKSNKYNEN